MGRKRREGRVSVCTCGLGDGHPHHESRDHLCPASPFYTAPIPHDEPAPGQTCVTCKRKVPHPRQPSSPSSKTFAYRVPNDEAVAHLETLETAARWVGVSEQPFERFKLLTLALALVLQDEGLRGFGQRGAA